MGSLALIPLRRNDQLDGVLIFGSYDPGRFNAELASDFLAHLGMVAALCIENAANRARLLRSGLTDFLTGFHNRRYLNARLREELARAQRFRQPIACLMIDVDHFKRINDKNGHLGWRRRAARSGAGASMRRCGSAISALVSVATSSPSCCLRAI